MFAMIGTQEVLVILAIALFIFGPSKLPEIGRQIAMALREVRKLSNDVQSAFNLDDHRYESRYEPSAYHTDNASTWTLDGDATNGDGADNHGTGDAIAGTRPWSIADDPGPGSGGDDAFLSEDYAPADPETARVLPPPVTTAEPPGPPSRQSVA